MAEERSEQQLPKLSSSSSKRGSSDIAGPLRILVTGPPGIGKTTLCGIVYRRLREEFGETVLLHGFLGVDRRERGRRLGFDMVTLDESQRAPLASVDVPEFEGLTLPILDEAINDGAGTPRAFIFDEIGKMELYSNAFVQRVRRLLRSPRPNLHVLGTVAMHGGKFIAESKRLPGVEVLEIDASTRDAQCEEVFARFRVALHSASPECTARGSLAPDAEGAAGAQTATDGPEALAQEADTAMEEAGVAMEEAGAAMEEVGAAMEENGAVIEEAGAAMEEAGPEAIAQEAEASIPETGQAMEAVEASTVRLDGEKTAQQAEMEQSASTGKSAWEQHAWAAVQENGAFPNNSESSVRTPWQGNLAQEPTQSAQAIRAAKETLLKFRFDGNLYRVPLMEHFHMNDIKKIITDTTGCNFDTVLAKYLDDEGDLCVLCAQTLPDCINLMSKAQQESMVIRLEVHDRGARAFHMQERRAGGYVACEEQRVHGPSVDEKLPWQVADQTSDEEEESLEGSPDEEESAGSVSSQDKNGFVLVDAEHQSDRCFLKSRTVLRSPDSGCKTVASLQEGDHVLSLSGRQLRVAFKKEHPKQLCQLTTLRTSATELTVTSDHRIIVSTGSRGPYEKAAEEILLGDKVFCGQKAQKVTKVMHHKQRAELVELRFTPDEPVETLMIAHAGILTKGERSPLLVQLEQPIEGLYERHTFLNVREPVISAASQRSRSAER